MGPHFRHRRRRNLDIMFAVVTVLTACAAWFVQSASAQDPPCQSCPYRMPPAGSPGGGSSQGGGPTAVPTSPVQALVSLGSITSSGGVASLTGTVNAAAGAVSGSGTGSGASVQVNVNGKPVGISSNGSFSATVGTGSGSGRQIVVSASEKSTGQTYTITIPAAAIKAGGESADVLAQLDNDQVTLLIPEDGLVSVDGNPSDAQVQAKATTGIAQLSLNGSNLLPQLKGSAGASSGGSGSGSGSGGGSAAPPPARPPVGTPPTAAPVARATVPGTARNARLTVTATNGASQTTTVTVQRVRSVIRVGRLMSVSAFGARGIRITGVQFETGAVARTHRINVTVTVRDRRNYLVRDAVVMLVPTARRTTISGSSARLTGLLGKASFTLPVAATKLGHRLYVTVQARTPRAATHLTRSVYLTHRAG